MVANERSDIDFIVLLAGPGVKIPQLMSEQNEAIFKSAGWRQEAITSFMSYYDGAMQIVIDEPDSVSIAQKIMASSDGWADTTSAELKNEIYPGNQRRPTRLLPHEALGSTGREALPCVE